MPAWQIPGVPNVPSMSDYLRLIQLQTEVMTELPETVAELSRAVRGLAETLDTAKETVASASRVVERMESILDELQEPLRDLRPGIERVGEMLDAPVVQRLPEVLESVERTVLPITQSSERIRLRIASLARRRQRVVASARQLVRRDLRH